MLTKLSFLFTKKILAYYNLLLLAYSKEKKRAATLLYTQREKKNPPEKKTIFLRNCNPFLFPFFARRSFLAQLNALFKNIKKNPAIILFTNHLAPEKMWLGLAPSSFFRQKWVKLFHEIFVKKIN